MAALPNGKLLLGGYTDTNGTFDFAVVRVNSDLSLDTSFGTNGSTIVDLGGSDVAEAMVVQPDGKILLAGDTTSAAGIRIGVVRLLAGGQPDTTFGHNGISIIAVGTATVQGWAIGLQANGDIVVGGTIKQSGSTQKNLLVVRIHGDASGNAGSGSGSGSGSGGGGSGSTGSTGTTGSIAPPGSTTLHLSVTAVRGTTVTVGSNLPKLDPAKVPKSGLLVTLSLSVKAKLTITITRTRRGQLASGHCRTVPAGATHVAHHCTARTQVISLHYSGAAGTNRFAFAGRLPNGQPLAAGSYTLAVSAAAGGAQVKARTLTFAVSGT